MTDKEAKAERTRLEHFVLKWSKLLGLHHGHTLHVFYSRTHSETRPGTAAEVEDMTQWKYKSFTIRFYMPITTEENDFAAESIVVHELTHCLLAPISCNMQGDPDDTYRADIMEFNTEAVTQAFGWVLQAGIDEGKQLSKEKK